MLCHIPLISETLGIPSFSEGTLFRRGVEMVMVFFVLSGFLIIGLLYDEKAKRGKIHIRNFYMRRILRLYPVYYLVLTFGFVFYHFLLPAVKIPFEINYNLAEGILWCVGFFPNVFRVLYDPGGILNILWSIGIEEQFYLVVAPLLYFLPIKSYLKIFALFTIGYLILFHLESFSFLKKYDFFYFFLTSGGVMAIAHRKGIRLYFHSSTLRWIVYAIFILYFTTDLFNFLTIKTYESIFQMILFNLTIINLINHRNFEIKNPFLNYLGRISYGIYMYHLIVVNFVLFLVLKTKVVTYFPDWLTILLINISCFIGTVFVAHISYKYFESYFLRKKKNYRN